jgi:hypothetical protein
MEGPQVDHSVTKPIHASALPSAACQEKQRPPPDTCSHIQDVGQSLEKNEFARMQPFVSTARIVVVHDVMKPAPPPLRRSAVPLLRRASGPPLCIQKCSFQL